MTSFPDWSFKHFYIFIKKLSSMQVISGLTIHLQTFCSHNGNKTWPTGTNTYTHTYKQSRMAGKPAVWHYQWPTKTSPKWRNWTIHTLLSSLWYFAPFIFFMWNLCIDSLPVCSHVFTAFLYIRWIYNTHTNTQSHFSIIKTLSDSLNRL